MNPRLSPEDRYAIADLFAAYAWALDTGDAEALAACFTEDGEVVEEVFEDPDHWRGRDGIRALGRHYFAAPNFPGRQHHIGQSRFQGGAPRCTAQSYVFVTECHGEPPYTLRFAGWYDDVLVKRDDAWLLEKRVIRLWDGPVLARFPGHGNWKPRKRPPELKVRK